MSQIIRKTALAVVIACVCHGPASASVPAGSAYKTDTQFSYVEDATSKGIGHVNMIACILSALKPDGVVNKGPYLALVDEAKCDPESRGGGADSGSDSSAQASSFTTVTVNSTRASNTDPMVVKAWLDENDDGQASTIWVHGSFSAAPSDDNPYGVFRLDFCGSGDNANCGMRGFVHGESGALTFYSDEDDDGGHASTMALHLTSVGSTTGSGKLSLREDDGNQVAQQEFLFAYDDDHFLRDNQCFSRDASDAATGMSVWKYGLYDASTGARVDRDSGFPIDYTTDGVTYHGFLGYYGLSLPSDVLAAMPSGATVQKVDYGTGQEPTRTDYTVVRAAGRLMKYTKHERTLHGIDKMRFNAFIGDANGFFAGASSNTQYTMYWDEANSNVKVIGKMNCSQNGCQSQEIAEQTVALSFWQSMGGIQGWSESLGGEVFIDLHAVPNPFNSDSVPVVYRTQDTVYPADMPANLYCVNNCPTASSMQTYFSGQSNDPMYSPFESSTYNNWQPSSTPVAYTMDTNSALLKDDQLQPVTLTDRDAAQSHPQYGNGLRSGRLFTSLNAAECAPNSHTYCDSKVNTLDVYYVWETGPSSYNQFAAVKDAQGNFVSLDAPLQVTFDVPADAIRYGEYAGKSIVLQYGGFGQLWGIPGHCVSHLTNETVSCDQDESRYVPEFVIPYDDATGIVHEGNNTYLVKWLEREIRFASKPLNECSALSLPANTTLPTGTDFNSPIDPQSDNYNGTRPAVTDAPRVVHGEVKY